MVPRMNYFSRTTPPSILLPAAREFDHLVVDTFCRKMALPALTDEARLQLVLPVREGGFGLSSVQVVSTAALNGVTSIEGMPVRSYTLRVLSFSLQSGNALLAIQGSKKAREKL